MLFGAAARAARRDRAGGGLLGLCPPQGEKRPRPQGGGVGLWLLDKQPAAWASRCELALREVLESLEGWQLVHEAEHVGHYVLETEDMGELDEAPVALAWGERESRMV